MATMASRQASAGGYVQTQNRSQQRSRDCPRPFLMHKPLTRACVALIIAVSCSETSTAAPVVVETDPLSPEEQREQFHLPDGFEIQLVACEPDIGQPMNLSFDAAGRLWVTHSIEYPYPADGEGVEPRDDRFSGVGDHEPRDRLTVLTGIGADGRPAEITHFRSDLNIPIGVAPARDGTIVFSIPNIWLCRDADGDGTAETRDRLYGTFGNVDTHGMTNSFTRWIDGWIYACHGFRNTSTITGADGHSITMNSGNTFRFREDGSRVEQITWGQVNPFGLTFDPWGNKYSADCHSRPLTCLIREGYYSSFGKPHDGLGFAPDMIAHDHGSTGICGAQWYAAEQFPLEYRGGIFLCNPVTGAVQRDRIEWRGSSPWAVEQPDFITCDDGWFRPVDVQLGPDGALYIADFYNAVIGHYEAPLDHPRRDREKGRIWRVVYTGMEESGSTGEVAGPPDLTQLDMTALVEKLADPNITVRTLATNLLHDRFGRAAGKPLRDVVVTSDSPEQRAHASWLLFRLKELDPFTLELLAGDPSDLVRTHLARILSETDAWQDEDRMRALRLLVDPEPMVRRAAAAAIARHPSTQTVAPLVEAFHSVPKDDSHLRHTLRIALRNHIADAEIVASESFAAAFEDYAELLAHVALGAPTPGAASLIARYLESTAAPVGQRPELISHVARYGNSALLDEFINRLRSSADRPAADVYADLLALIDGFQSRGGRSSDRVAPWAGEFAIEQLEQSDEGRIGWIDAPLPGRTIAAHIFSIQRRPSADGDARSLFFSSLPAGEQQTGLLRSGSFVLPPRFSFFIAGHNGVPDKPPQPNNRIQLVESESGELLLSALPPRNDTAQLVEWDLSAHSGKTGRIEIIDGDDDGAFAWLAVGRFSVDGLNPQAYSPVDAAADLIIRLRLASASPVLSRIVLDNEARLTDRLRCANALLALNPDARLSTLLGTASARHPGETAERILSQVVSPDGEIIRNELSKVLQTATAASQRQLAIALAADHRGAETLLQFVEAGRVSPRVLTDPLIAERVTTILGSESAARIESLTAGVPSASEEIDRLIAERLAEFSTEGTSPEQGRAVFKKHCAACHQFAGEGKKVGPQLDGIGVRGPNRLLEDLLDPNRNVDAAFRTTAVVTTEGRVITGLKLREEGEIVVIVNNKGEEVRLAKSEIEEQSDSPLSLMPSNLGEVIPPEDLHELLAELLRSSTKPGD
ncbi:MAG: hypothetical protein DWQ34_09130 [Planctomycetota bacterium]|nr:MAG: hypothetical protein DWQ34_09130 [Planctomycetota bacterium]